MQTAPGDVTPVEPASYARRVVVNTGLQAAGHLVSIAAAVASVAILTRYLGVAGYGDYSIVLVFLMLAATAAEGGLNAIAVRTFAQHDPVEPRTFQALLGLRVTASVAVSLVAVAVMWLLPYSAAVRTAALAAGAAVVFTSVTLTLVTVFQARLEFRLPVVLDLVPRLLALAGYALLAALLPADAIDARARLTLVFAVLAGATLAALVVAIGALRRRGVRVGLAFDRARWRWLLARALPLALVSILGLVNYRLDMVVLSILKDSAAVGIYGLAYRFVEAALPLATFFVATTFPILSRSVSADPARRTTQMQRGFDFLATLALPISLMTFALAPRLVELIAGEAYAPAVTPLRVLILSLPFTFASMFLVYAVIAHDLQRRLLWLVSFAIALNLVLNLILVPPYSYTGAAASTLATELIGMAILVVVVQRWLALRLSFVFPLRALLAASAMFAAALALVRVNLALAVAAPLLLYALLVVALGIVTRAELRSIAGRA